MESQEIRRLWPKYNLAQKYRAEEWGIFSYEDQGGYQRFSVNRITRAAKPVIKFSSKGDAWNFLWEKVHAYELCPKLSGLQVKRGPCLSLQAGQCKGACAGVEKPARYNRRVTEAIQSVMDNPVSVVLVDKGRNETEKSVVLIEKGKFAGYGFISKKKKITSVRAIKKYVKNNLETSTVQNLINSYLLNPRGVNAVIIG